MRDIGPLKLFGLLQLDSEPKKQHWGNNTQSQGDSPGKAQVLLGTDDDQKIWDESTDHKSPVDHHVREEDEPAIPRSTLQFPTRLRASYRPSGVLSSNPHPDQETIGGQSCEHALEIAMVSVGGGTERGEDDQDDGG